MSREHGRRAIAQAKIRETDNASRDTCCNHGIGASLQRDTL